MDPTYYRTVGTRIDYTPDADVAAGDVVVQGTLLGVATEKIEADALGSLAIEGVFDFPKEEVAMTVGQDVYWDDNADVAFTPGATGMYIGKCVKAAAATDARVRVKLVLVNADESSTDHTATGTGTGVLTGD